MVAQKKNRPNQEVVGLLPAGGQATRIAPLPCSKELYPIGFHLNNEGHSLRPKVVCHYLLENMRHAGIIKVYIILRQGKWDIPAYLGDGSALGMHLAYLMMNLPYGAPFTLDQAYPFIQDKVVALGFPDTVLQPIDTFVYLLDRLQTTEADVVLGVYPTDQPQKGDMVDTDETGRVRQLIIKSTQTQIRQGWTNAVWTPVFTQFMHNYLKNTVVQSKQSGGDLFNKELFVGDVIQAAIDEGLVAQSVFFPQGSYLDIGTPDEMIKAIWNNINRVTVNNS